MSGNTYTLPQAVLANADTEISVPMTAPNKAGSARGNWRMSTTAGQFFGDEVYLVVMVGGTSGAPAVPTATATP